MTANELCINYSSSIIRVTSQYGANTIITIMLLWMLDKAKPRHAFTTAYMVLLCERKRDNMTSYVPQHNNFFIIFLGNVKNTINYFIILLKERKATKGRQLYNHCLKLSLY